MGMGSLLAVSTSVSKSSTEAELIAVTDLIEQAMDLKRVADEIIGEEIKLIIYQDNESTIKLMKSGTVGARSKHVKIRFAWMKEAIEAEDFRLKYKATTEMLADGMTKGKQGKEILLHSKVELEFKFVIGTRRSVLKKRSSESCQIQSNIVRNEYIHRTWREERVREP